MAEYETISLNLVGFPPAAGKPAQHLSILAQSPKDSGLAYHPVADEPDETSVGQDFDENVYIITQVCSGKRLGRNGVATPRQAKLWIGLLGRICDWNQDLNVILAGLEGRGRPEKLVWLTGQIERARLEAIEQTFFIVTGG